MKLVLITTDDDRTIDEVLMLVPDDATPHKVLDNEAVQDCLPGTLTVTEIAEDIDHRALTAWRAYAG